MKVAIYQTAVYAAGSLAALIIAQVVFAAVFGEYARVPPIVLALASVIVFSLIVAGALGTFVISGSPGAPPAGIAILGGAAAIPAALLWMESGASLGLMGASAAVVVFSGLVALLGGRALRRWKARKACR